MAGTPREEGSRRPAGARGRALIPSVGGDLRHWSYRLAAGAGPPGGGVAGRQLESRAGSWRVCGHAGAENLPGRCLLRREAGLCGSPPGAEDSRLVRGGRQGTEVSGLRCLTRSRRGR